jgi:hypothetical protein
VSSHASEGARDGLAEAASVPGERAATREEARSRVSLARRLALLGGLLAGLASFAAGEATYKIIPTELGTQIDGMNRRERAFPTFESVNMAAAKNASLAFGALGFCLGGLLGIAGGVARRSTTAAVTGGLLGVVLGAFLGAGVSRALLPFSLKAQFAYPDNELIISLLMHGLIWGLVGASAGLAFAVGLGDRRLVGRALIAGLAGAVLGAVAFEIIGAVFFTSANTSHAVSETWPTRLLARLLVAIGTAATLALLLPEPGDVVAKHRADTSAPAPEQQP